jgi:hypothetical protein
MISISPMKSLRESARASAYLHGDTGSALLERFDGNSLLGPIALDVEKSKIKILPNKKQ